MEHDIYRVIRRRTNSGFELVLEDHRAIKSRGVSVEEAEEGLLDLICEKFGDGEPVLDYLDDSVGTVVAEIWRLECNQRLTTKNIDDVFPGGICARCGNVLGKRSRHAVREVGERVRADAAFTKSGNQQTLVFSDRMVSLLLELGLVRDDFASVRDLSESIFWELLVDNANLTQVPVKLSLAHRAGALRCPKCRFERFGFVHHVDKDIRKFILEHDWKKSDANVGVLGPVGPEPVFSSKGRDVILKRKELRGFVWARVGLVKSADVETKLKFDPFPKP